MSACPQEELETVAAAKEEFSRQVSALKNQLVTTEAERKATSASLAESRSGLDEQLSEVAQLLADAEARAKVHFGGLSFHNSHL